MTGGVREGGGRPGATGERGIRIDGNSGTGVEEEESKYRSKRDGNGQMTETLRERE